MYSFQPLPDKLSQTPEDFMVPLNDWGIVTVEGEDAAKFLHSQLTVDVNKLDVGQVRRTAHCDFKGKTWSVGLLARASDKYWYLAQIPALQASLEQFRKYGVFSKITLTELTESCSLFAVHGAAVEPINDLFNACPASPMSLEVSDAGLCLQLDYPKKLVITALNKPVADTFTETCQQTGIPVYPRALFEALSIASGVPAISQDEHINQFVPQMMNLQALDSIDFNKGCYMGQEVVARTRYLGKNKRAAAIFKLLQQVNSDGVSLEKQVGEHWRSGGTILRMAELGSETWILAIVNNDITPEEVFRLSGLPEVELIHCDLPYTLDS